MSDEMAYGHVGRSGLLVSPIGLGIMNFGFTADESTSSAIMDAAIDAGINFFDTADVYGGPQTPDMAKGYGISEEIIGRWLRRSGRRLRTALHGPHLRAAPLQPCGPNRGDGADPRAAQPRHRPPSLQPAPRRPARRRARSGQRRRPHRGAPRPARGVRSAVSGVGREAGGGCAGLAAAESRGLGGDHRPADDRGAAVEPRRTVGAIGRRCRGTTRPDLAGAGRSPAGVLLVRPSPLLPGERPRGSIRRGVAPALQQNAEWFFSTNANARGSGDL